MTKYLRPLALMNLGIAVLFLLPAACWVAGEYFTRGNLEVRIPEVQALQGTLDEIRKSKDIEVLRHRAKVLTEARAFDEQLRLTNSRITDQLYQGFLAFVVLSGLALLVNGTFLLWAFKRIPASR